MNSSDVIVGATTGSQSQGLSTAELKHYLNSCMATEVKVKLGGMCDRAVHSGACWDVAALTHLLSKAYY